MDSNQNEEKMLTIDEAYDAVVDYLEKIYRKNKIDDIGILAGEMNLLSDGSSADPAAIEDWQDSVNKILDKNLYDRKNFEIVGNKLSAKQAYEAVWDFLDGYRGRINSDEVAEVLKDMRLVKDGVPVDPVFWNLWIESVNKILSEYPRIRPLFFGINIKFLNIDFAYNVVIDWLKKYYIRTKFEDVNTLLKNIKLLDSGVSADSEVWDIWNKSIQRVLKNEPIETGLNIKEAYEVFMLFLDEYGHRINSDEILNMLKGMQLVDELESADPEAWRYWVESVNKILNKYRKF